MKKRIGITSSGQVVMLYGDAPLNLLFNPKNGRCVALGGADSTADAKQAGDDAERYLEGEGEVDPESDLLKARANFARFLAARQARNRSAGDDREVLGGDEADIDPTVNQSSKTKGGEVAPLFPDSSGVERKQVR